MAGSFSNFLENEVLDHVLGTGAYSSPSPFVALFTVAPTDAGGGTEVTGGSYARQAASFGAAASGAATTDADINFPTATANWGTVVALALFDASTAGNMLMWGDLAASKTINNGTQARILTGDLDVTLD